MVAGNSNCPIVLWCILSKASSLSHGHGYNLSGGKNRLIGLPLTDLIFTISTFVGTAEHKDKSKMDDLDHKDGVVRAKDENAFNSKNV